MSSSNMSKDSIDLLSQIWDTKCKMKNIKQWISHCDWKYQIVLLHIANLSNIGKLTKLNVSLETFQLGHVKMIFNFILVSNFFSKLHAYATKAAFSEENDKYPPTKLSSSQNSRFNWKTAKMHWQLCFDLAI